MMEIEQETLNHMSFTLLRVLEAAIEQGVVNDASIQIETKDGDLIDLEVAETLEVCLLGLAEKLGLVEEEQ